MSSHLSLCPDDSNGAVRARRPGCAGKFTPCWRAQHAQRCRIIFGLAAGEYATCVIMAHVYDGCALRDSPLPRLNRVKGTFLRAFSTLAQLSPSPCHALQVALHFSFFFHSFSLLLLAVSSLRSVLRAAAAALCAFCVVRCRCFTFLFEKERVKREEGESKCAVVVVVEGRRKEERDCAPRGAPNSLYKHRQTRCERSEPQRHEGRAQRALLRCKRKEGRRK